MSKCEHGEKISQFCASECCVWKDAGGCQQCMKKYHNHMGPTLFLNEEQVILLMSKYSVDHSAKPKCRLVQEAIYNYFTLMKTELTNSIDSLCKNIINQIGYPYLYQNNILSTYKRIKSKEYRKLQQKEFKAFYEETSKLNERELVKQEGNIYMEQINKTVKLLNTLDKWVLDFQGITKQNTQLTFQHDQNSIRKINELTQSIQSKLSDSTPNTKFSHNKTSSFHGFFKEVSKTNEPPTLKEEAEKDNEIKVNIFESKTPAKKGPVKKDTFNNPLKQSGDQGSRATRDVSLDKKIMRRFAPEQKQEPAGKQLEINEKKKILLNMMKQKEESLLKVKEQVFVRPISALGKVEAQSFEKITRVDDLSPRQQDANQREFLENSQAYAYAKLPEEDKKVEEPINTEIKRRKIAIPGLSKLTDPSNIQIQSPLLKKKQEDKKHQEEELIKVKQTKKPQPLYSKLGQERTKKKDQMKQSAIDARQKRTQSIQSEKKEEVEMQENQELSVALLVRSLTAKIQDAIPLLESALKQADNNLSAAEYLSYLYLEIGKPKECLQLCNTFLDRFTEEEGGKNEKDFLLLQSNKGAALNQLGRYSQSIILLQKCLSFGEKDFLFKNLGDAYFLGSLYEKAIYNYEKALRLTDSYEEAYYNMAVCLYMQENYHNAKLTIEKALSTSPKQEQYLQLEQNILNKLELV